jgi:phosphate transport system substrate-binding protein
MKNRFPLPRRTSIPRLIFLGLLLLLLTACGATVTPPPPVFFTVAGSTSMEPLLTDLTAAYTERHPHVSFDIQGGGSHLGQTLVESRQVDLGMVSWSPDELAAEVQLIPLARDAIALIVHPDNQLAGLSRLEVRDIFSGRLLNWQAVDGPALPIQVLSREDGSGTRAAFESLVMDEVPVTPTAVVLPNSRAIVEFVAQNPNAIAYVSYAFATDDVYVVPLEGITPTLDTITSNSYPLIRDLALIAPSQGQREVAEFIEFVLSPTGQGLVPGKWGQVR